MGQRNTETNMNTNNLLRYSCQIPLKEFGIKSQKKLAKSKVLIVGMGGLGCPAGQYLAAAGVGTLGLVDFDDVSIKNLHRQILYGEKDAGKAKTTVSNEVLKRQNPSVKFITYYKKINPENVFEIIKQYDTIVDCTDNFETRYLLNDACVMLQKPLMYGAIFQFEGQAAFWNIKNSDGSFSSNIRDVFPKTNSFDIPNCETGGVIPTIAGIIGCIQATEVIKYLIGNDNLLKNRLLIFDAIDMKSTTISLPTKTQNRITSLEKQNNISFISPKELRQTKKEYEIIDVRTKGEHRNLNIGGKNIPLDTLLKNLYKIDFQKPVVFYCNSGARSIAAAKQILKIHPEAKVMSLTGGIRAYKNAD